MREGSKVGVCGPLPAFIQGLGGLVDLKTPKTALPIHYNGPEFSEHWVPLKVLQLREKKKPKGFPNPIKSAYKREGTWPFKKESCQNGPDSLTRWV